MTVPDSEHVDVPSEVRKQAATLAADLEQAVDAFPNARGVRFSRAMVSRLRALGLFISVRTWAPQFYEMTPQEQRQLLLQLSEGRSRA